MTKTSRTPSLPPARWAVRCAWLAPVTILPSAIWRLSLLAGEDHPLGEDGWYLVLLSVLSMGLGLLTLGLVRSWGENLPRWVPVLGGRTVPPRVVAGIAVAGGVTVIAACLWGALHAEFGVAQGPVLIGDDSPAEEPPGTTVTLLYAPMVLWGPLVILLALDHYRRRTAAQIAA
jgi:hypothetical protein